MYRSGVSLLLCGLDGEGDLRLLLRRLGEGELLLARSMQAPSGGETLMMSSAGCMHASTPALVCEFCRSDMGFNVAPGCAQAGKYSHCCGAAEPCTRSPVLNV